ncbi:MAG: SoxR reducing system RseC family protein [Spirochaetaceae bacterium]
MKDTATVEKIEGHRITLMCGAGEACRSCKANSFCASKTREVSAINQKGIPLNRGDKVEFFIPPGRTILAGFVVLIVPLIIFILAFLAAGEVLPSAGEGLQALFGIFGLAIGFGFSFIFNKIAKDKNLPRILRKISDT